MTASERSVTFRHGEIVTFHNPVRRTAIFPDAIIVLTYPLEAHPGTPTDNRNLFAYDLEGKLLWRGDDQRFPGEGNEVNPYVDVERIDDELMSVWDYYGTIYTMVARTGEIRDREWGK